MEEVNPIQQISSGRNENLDKPTRSSEVIHIIHEDTSIHKTSWKSDCESIDFRRKTCPCIPNEDDNIQQESSVFDSFDLIQSKGKKSVVRRKSKFTVEFHLKTKPAYFGNSVTVYCRMASSFEQSGTHMAWFKNVTRQVAQNKRSYYPSKYQITVEYDSKFMYYYLTILRFAVDDVNILYRCDFGFDSHKEPLNLESKSFIALPDEGTTEKSLNTKNDNLTGFVRILNIYPMPRCEILYEGHNYTKDVIMTFEQSEVFYNVTLTFASNAKMSRCHGVLNISCYFGTQYMSILEDKINYCDDTIEGNSGQYEDGVLITVLAVVCPLMLVICVSLCIISRRRVGSTCCRIGRNDSGNNGIKVFLSLTEPGPKFDERDCMMSRSTEKEVHSINQKYDCGTTIAFDTN